MSLQETIDCLASGEEERLLLRRIAERSDRCQRQQVPECTRFLTQRERGLAEQVLAMAGSPRHDYLGGPGNPERTMLYMLPDWMECIPSGDDSPITFLCCKWDSRFGQVGHRDLLGSLMGLGIKRDTVGDIYLEQTQAFVVISRDILAFLLQNWDSAGRVRLSCSEIAEEDVHITEAKTTQIRDTVSSLRLDSIVSAGFGMAREKAAALIRAGRVQLDHADCLKPDRLVAQGAVLTIRGLGRAELSEVGGLSKKGRVGIVIRRYLD